MNGDIVVAPGQELSPLSLTKAKAVQVWIAEAQDLETASNLMSGAGAMSAVVKRFKKRDGVEFEAIFEWARADLEARRKVGELMQQMRDAGELAKRGYPGINDGDGISFISDYSLTKSDSKFCQRLTSIPQESWDNEFVYLKDKGLVPTLAHFLNLWRELNPPVRGEWVEPEVVKESAMTWLLDVPKADLILTDPPYMTDVEDIGKFAKSWLPLALKKLKPSGRLFTFVGPYPQEIHAYLNAAMPKQIMAWRYDNTLGPKPTHNYINNWQAILYFAGPEAKELNEYRMTEQFAAFTESAPDARQGIRYHAWEKPERIIERIIKQTTGPNDLVLDPFVGTGTTLVMAGSWGRRSIGCDIDASMLKIASRRIKNERNSKRRQQSE